MALRTGANLRVVVGQETAFGSGQTTPVGYDIPKASCSFNWSEDSGKSDELLSNPNPAQPIRGLHKAAGQLVQVCDLDSPGVMLKRFLTSYGQSGTAAPFTNTFKIAATAPASIWVEIGDVAVGKYDLLKGNKIIGFSVSVTKQAQTFKITWDLLGNGNKATLYQSTPYDATPDTFTGLRTTQADATLKVQTVVTTSLTSFECQVKRADEAIQVLDGNRHAAAITDGGYEITGKVTAEWDDTNTFRGYCTGDTEVALELIIPKPGDATRYISIKAEECKLFLTSPPSVSGPGKISVSFDFIGYYQDCAAASALTVTLVNDTQTYV